MAIDRYTWEPVRGCSDDLEAYAEDGTRILFTLDDHDNVVSAELIIFKDSYTSYTTADTQDWPKVEQYVPRAEWPIEVNAYHAGGRADQALLDAIDKYRAEMAEDAAENSDPDSLDDWLGDAADELTDEQRATLAAAADRIATMCGDDDQEAVDEGITAAYQVITGETTLERLAQAERQALARYNAAIDATRGAMALERQQGLTVTGIADKAGVTRTTVYKRLGRKK